VDDLDRLLSKIRRVCDKHPNLTFLQVIHALTQSAGHLIDISDEEFENMLDEQF